MDLDIMFWGIIGMESVIILGMIWLVVLAKKEYKRSGYERKRN